MISFIKEHPKFSIFFCICFTAVAYMFIAKFLMLEDDNDVEQIIEEVIYANTNAEIDLSPGEIK